MIPRPMSVVPTLSVTDLLEAMTTGYHRATSAALYRGDTNDDQQEDAAGRRGLLRRGSRDCTPVRMDHRMHPAPSAETS
jgi:hypothetical protein